MYDSGDVTVNGHSGDDEIITGAGNDNVRGGHGNDYIFTDDGDDMIRGGDGRDYLYGAGGDDTILGEDGNDRVYGGDGNDALMGEGNDTLDGGAGADQFLFNLVEGGNGTVHTGWDIDEDLVLINNVGVEANIALHLGAGDQAIGYTASGHEIDLDAFYAAADGADFMIGATTFTDEVFGGKS